MNTKRYIFAALATFVFVFIYGWLVHGVLLMDFYMQSKDVWRDFKEMEDNFLLTCTYQLVLSFWTAFVFTKLFPSGGFNNGITMGLYFGVFAGILTAAWYLWLPVPAPLGLGWFISGIGEGLGSGIILGLIYKKS